LNPSKKWLIFQALNKKQKLLSLKSSHFENRKNFPHQILSLQDNRKSEVRLQFFGLKTLTLGSDGKAIQKKLLNHFRK
jgi:hypothetical protein